MAAKRSTGAVIVTVAGLGVVAALCLWGVVIALRQGVPSIGVHGWIALGLAVVVGGGVSAGLMWLMFYSARKGFDDDVAPHDPNP